MAEFSYQPGKCEKCYRMVALKKIIKVTKGELKLFDDVRYFFYITNETKMSAKELIEFYRGRRITKTTSNNSKTKSEPFNPPSDNLVSNWAYMVIASLAWDLKACMAC
ncbi:MAG: hypothetical protein RBT11_13905 [Desulfobacterales bacterium]|jgi:hypothetical protein|nr:hypothetical protein [Desulfobacterales bacterium]